MIAKADLARLQDWLAAVAGGLRPAAQVPARLHVGEEAWTELRVHYLGRSQDIAGQDGSADFPPAMLGVPVTVGSLNSAIPLPPRGWRLVNQAGEIISSGELTDPEAVQLPDGIHAVAMRTMRAELRGWGPDYTNIDVQCPEQCAWEYTWEDSVSIAEIVRVVDEHLAEAHPSP